MDGRAVESGPHRDESGKDEERLAEEEESKKTKYICWSHINVPMSMSPNWPTACRRHTEGEAVRCKEPAIPSNAQALCPLLIHVESAEMNIDFSSSGLFGCFPLGMCIIRILASIYHRNSATSDGYTQQNYICIPSSPFPFCCQTMPPHKI